MRTIINYVYFFSFWIILLTFPLFSILGLRTTTNEHFEKKEKRKITRLPAFNWNSKIIKNYFSKSEAFFGDHLAFRDDLLKINAKIMLRLGRAMNPDELVIGKDGWLFLGNKQQGTIDQYRGLKQMNENQLQAWFNYFNSIQNYLKTQNIPFYVAIAPDKHSIYPEYLPSNLSRKGITPYDQVMASNKSLKIIDLRRTLIEAKTNFKLPLYYKTDSHWNAFGAYIAYKEIQNHTESPFNSFSLNLQESNFTSKFVERKTDLQVMLNGDEIFNEIEVYINGKLSPEPLKLKKNNEWIDLNPNSGVEILKQNNVVLNKFKTGKLLLIGDSFSHSLSKYFNNTFGTVFYRYSLAKDSGSIVSLIKLYQPDIVLFEVVERCIILPVDWFLPLNGKSDDLSITNSLSNEILLKGSDFQQQIANVSLSDHGINFTATGNDPYFILPEMQLPDKNINLKIEITSPNSTVFQVFYLTDSTSEYSEKKSIRKPIVAGRQQINIPIKTQLIRGRLRVDPGAVAGDYVIHKIEILEED